MMALDEKLTDHESGNSSQGDRNGSSVCRINPASRGNKHETA